MPEAEKGIVVGVSGEEVSISLKRGAACGNCRACASGLSKDEMRMNAKNECRAELGDVVRVELRDGAFISSALIVYGLPLLLMLVGFLCGRGLSGVFTYLNPELLSFVMGILFLGLGYVIIRKIDAMLNKNKYRPAAVEIVKKNGF